MVSTRHHPRAYPPPELATPDAKSSMPASNSTSGASAAKESKPRSVRGKSRPRVSTTSPGPTTTSDATTAPASPTSPTAAAGSGALTRTRSRRAPASVWSHTPSNLTLVWLAVSLPLVIWDTGYVLGRPWTMPGGWLHWPVWAPYELYGKVDYIYGWPAIEKRNGFTSAQGSLNVIETVMYLGYLWMVYKYGEQDSKKTTSRGRARKSIDGRGAPGKKVAGWFGEARVLAGGYAGAAVLLAFAASVMTLSKTILYWFNEYFSFFDNIGHNSVVDLIFLWIIPNGAWIIVPTYMTYAFGAEILEGLTIASGASVPKALATKEE